MPAPCTWCWWLNGTGCSTRSPSFVTHGDLCNRSSPSPTPANSRTIRAMLVRAYAFALCGKNCAIYQSTCRCGPKWSFSLRACCGTLLLGGANDYESETTSCDLLLFKTDDY